jgi:glutamate/tyrosine decarboxylase-like PLP-dependent enzyme
MSDSDRRTLERAAELAREFLEGLPERRVGPAAGVQELRERFGVGFTEDGEDPTRVLEDLAKAADGGLVASAGPRYFGFVIGGSYSVGVAADWLTNAWDQNAGLYATSPAAAVAEEVAARWLVELLGLPETVSVGFTTGAGAANAVAVMAARHALLAREGWDVEARGLYGAPEINVLIGEEAHITVPVALQYAGLGRERVIKVAADSQGRMRRDALAEALRGVRGPTLVCAQAGNVNTGACDPLEPVADACREHEAWLHVDGAFGLWAAASPSLVGLLAGVDRADSWSTDAHKWLNVPYDCGVVFVRDAAAHRAAMTSTASYYVQSARGERDPFEYVLDNSRRARGFSIYAVLRSLGRRGVRELVERCCRLARLMADRLGAEPSVEILNEVVLNQVLVRFGESDELTNDVIRRVQEGGVAWLGGTTWHGLRAMRVSVSNWMTSEEDIERGADAILEAHREAPSAAGRDQRTLVR